jgi:hypothetical protein
VHPFIKKSYQTIMTLVLLYNGQLDFDAKEYTIEAKHLQTEYFQDLEVYRPEVDDPTRPVAEYHHDWWWDNSLQTTKTTLQFIKNR